MKVGKSFLGLNEAWDKVANGVPTAYFDTEMTTKEFLLRLISRLSGVPIPRIKSGKINDKEAMRIKEVKEYIKRQKHFTHKYEPNWQMDDIYLACRELERSMGLDFLVYDYIKTNEAGSLDMKEHNHLGDLTNFLKNSIAGSLNIPVLSFAQMAKDDMRIADSDKINRYASVVAYLLQKDSEEIAEDGVDGGNRKLVIDYNRLGQQFEQSGEHINLKFNGDMATFAQAKVQPYEVEQRLFNPE